MRDASPHHHVKVGSRGGGGISQDVTLDEKHIQPNERGWERQYIYYILYLNKE
jgi:hypothetical protein